jgi:hypothetical protein
MAVKRNPIGTSAHWQSRPQTAKQGYGLENPARVRENVPGVSGRDE